MFNSTSFTLGTTVSFEYNGILRQGVVEKVGKTAVTLLLMHDKDGKQFKAFRYDGMRVPTNTGWAVVEA